MGLNAAAPIQAAGTNTRIARSVRRFQLQLRCSRGSLMFAVGGHKDGQLHLHLTRSIPTPDSHRFQAAFPALQSFLLLVVDRNAGCGCGSGNVRGGGGGGGGGGGSGGNDEDVPRNENFWTHSFWPFLYKDAKSDDGSREWRHGSIFPQQCEKDLNSKDLRIPVSELEARRFECTCVEFLDADGSVLDASWHSPAALGLQPGCIFTRQDVEAAISRLSSIGWYQYVKGYCVRQSDAGMKVVFEVVGFENPPVTSCTFVNQGGQGQGRPSLRNDQAGPCTSCLLPLSVQAEISEWVRLQARVTVATLKTIQEMVERWYYQNGYSFAKVKSFGGVVDGALQCNVVEGDVMRLRILHKSKSGRRVQGRTRDCVILRQLPKLVREGMPYNVGAGKAALHNIFQLRLFEKVQVTPQPDPELADNGGVMLDLVVSERPVNSAHVDTEWSFVATNSGRPDLGTLQPGGSVVVEHRNMGGLNRSICGSVATTNIFQPQDDLRFKLEYLHPHLDGYNSDLNRTFRATCFSKRKLGAIFASGHQRAAMWVDRAGIKLNVTENLTKRSKLTYGAVVEEVGTRDEASVIRHHGAQYFDDETMQYGGLVSSSRSGIDHLAFLQTKIIRDSTRFVNGTEVGARDLFQVDQGIGIGGGSPMFNRHQLAMTRFSLLRKAPLQSDQAPGVLILHGRYGGCIGDVRRYHAFTTGGPYSLRAHNEGELPRSKHFLEVAGEVRLPVQKSQLYAYVEMVAELGSGRDGRRGLWRRVQRGACLGAGVNFGGVRAEYVVECATNTGSFRLGFGERR